MREEWPVGVVLDLLILTIVKELILHKKNKFGKEKIQSAFSYYTQTASKVFENINDRRVNIC